MLFHHLVDDVGCFRNRFRKRSKRYTKPLSVVKLLILNDLILRREMGLALFLGMGIFRGESWLLCGLRAVINQRYKRYLLLPVATHTVNEQVPKRRVLDQQVRTRHKKWRAKYAMARHFTY
ncbi:hypothetical protein [Thalassospira australica]|uniref:hypothetical protein n=1 Tax=Thalassospira australica TaxID=1528106 RepID=UPI00051A1184|nr:hypothetical protein [Thalassospira australica]